MKEFVVQMAEIFKALGDPNRLKIIKLLVLNQDEPLCVADLAERLGISQPAVSQHLKILRNINVVIPHKVGFHVYYKVDTTLMKTLTGNVEKLLGLAFDGHRPEE
ncbi:MAG: winged helix-turn-helix transcriptional regulator [Candidatus Cloacimonetes bacterium]|nr:winged helix-turn-helix transcriptional regulator [Candidatus Cloacimonadota bacterium]